MNSRKSVQRASRGLCCVLTIMILAVAAQPVTAVIIPAATNAEVRVSGASSTDSTGDPSGIREFAGATSTLFFNIQGSANAPFEVFGVADFPLPADPLAGSVAAASLTLYEDPASFAAPGTVEIYLAGDASPGLIDVSANPAAGVPSYQTGSNSLASVDPAFAPFGTLIGAVPFLPVGPGVPTTIPLFFTGVEEAAAVAAARAGGTLRLLFAPADATTAATFAGQANFDGPPPTLDIRFLPIPEPTSTTLILLGSFVGSAVIRRRPVRCQPRELGCDGRPHPSNCR